MTKDAFLTNSSSYVGTRWANARRVDLKESDVVKAFHRHVQLFDGKRRWWISVNNLLRNYDQVPGDISRESR